MNRKTQQFACYQIHLEYFRAFGSIMGETVIAEKSYNEIRKVKTVCLLLFISKHERCRSLTGDMYLLPALKQIVCHEITQLGYRKQIQILIGCTFTFILSIVCFREAFDSIAFIYKACLCIVCEYKERKLTANSSQAYHKMSTLETTKENRFSIL